MHNLQTKSLIWSLFVLTSFFRHLWAPHTGFPFLLILFFDFFRYAGTRTHATHPQALTNWATAWASWTEGVFSGRATTCSPSIFFFLNTSSYIFVISQKGPYTVFLLRQPSTKSQPVQTRVASSTLCLFHFYPLPSS